MECGTAYFLQDVVREYAAVPGVFADSIAGSVSPFKCCLEQQVLMGVGLRWICAASFMAHTVGYLFV